MKLTYHEDDPSIFVRERYPHGYWFAMTDDERYDADGPDPLTAVTRLVLAMEKKP